MKNPLPSKKLKSLPITQFQKDSLARDEKELARIKNPKPRPPANQLYAVLQRSSRDTVLFVKVPTGPMSEITAAYSARTELGLAVHDFRGEYALVDVTNITTIKP